MALRYPNGKLYTKNTKKKEKMFIDYGNRGMSLESEIEETNLHYLVSGKAVFNKRPTPIKVLNVQHKQITSAYFEKPSTVDYYGVYKGKYIDFEAKETQSKTSLPLNNIHPHQIDHMKNILKHDGESFLICRFVKIHKTYFLDAKYVIECWDGMHVGGRKSIPLSYFQENGIEIKTTYLAKVDYLPIIEKMYM